MLLILELKEITKPFEVFIIVKMGIDFDSLLFSKYYASKNKEIEKVLKFGRQRVFIYTGQFPEYDDEPFGEELLSKNPNWSYLWRLLATASGKLNKKGIAYISLAEEALIKKNFIKAKKYVDLANKQASLPISYKLRGSDILNKIKLKYKKK